MRFHTIKMDEINKIIKELWMKTYKGGGGCGLNDCSCPLFRNV